MTKLKPISATKLGRLAAPDACHRCWWLEYNLGSMPYTVFPRVFNDIDGYTKQVAHAIIDRGQIVTWMQQFRPNGYLPEMHWRKFSAELPNGLTTRGMFDDIWTLADGSLAIIDYKTSKNSNKQDSLHPRYATQLNAYAYIAEALGLGRVSKLALIYFEPQTDLGAEQTRARSQKFDSAYFDMAFKATVVPVSIQRDTLFATAETAKRLAMTSAAPAAHPKCKNCEKLEKIRRSLT